MHSHTPFVLSMQPNDQRKPAPPPKRTREPKDSPNIKAASQYWDHHLQPATPHETLFRHSGWSPKRDKIRKYLLSIGTREKAMDMWDQCGGECSVMWSETAQKHKLAANYCHSRHCEPCMRAKANRLAANLKNRLEQNPKGRYRFITLTLRHSRKPLKEQLKRLYLCFKLLRKTKMWKATQIGGALTVEVKWKSDSRKWHPHLHIIAEGSFIEQRALSNAWEKITGDSKIVDIRILKSGKDAAHYVSKYVTKGTSNEVWNDTDAAQEWLVSSKGLRCCATFGKWRGFKLLAIDKSITDWQPVCSLDSLMARVKSGEEAAIQLMLILRPPGDHDTPRRPTPPLDPKSNAYTSS